MWAADKGAGALIEAKEAMRGAGDADAFALAEEGAAKFGCGTPSECTQPEGARGTKVCAVEGAIDMQSGRQASRTTGEVERSCGLAATLHLLDTFQGLQGADQDAAAGSRGLGADVEHEVVAVGEIDVGVATAEKHGAIARGGSAKVVRGRIARRVGFGFDDPAAKAAAREFADDDFADQKASQRHGVQREFGAAKAPDGNGNLAGCQGSQAQKSSEAARKSNLTPRLAVP
jgi:hypothetical protein